jgi:hypothetical protein
VETFVICTYHQILLGRSNQENQVGGACGTHEGRKLYRLLVRKPEGKRALERPRRRWQDGIRVDLREIGWRVWSGFTLFRITTGGGLW